MAGNAFTVEPAALNALAQRLDKLAGTMAEARTVTRRVDGSAFGDQRLTDATKDFVDAWEWQASKLGEMLTQTAQRLTTAAEQYQAVEDAQLMAQGQKRAD